MITDLEIANFQSHEYTALEFVPGTNVILGNSDTGKSSIIRAINWAVSNRPSGDSFRANFTKKDTEISIAFGEDYVSRKKGKGINGYSTGQDDYKALRTDVPDGVKAITRMEEVNIQPQYKSYFLLDETPGNVAKAFNSVSGLEKMDAALKNINSKVRATSSALAINLKEAVSIEEQIEELNWIADAEKILTQIENMERKLSEKKEKIRNLQLVLQNIFDLEEKLTALPDMSALPAIETIHALDISIDTKLQIHNNLDRIVQTIGELQKKQKRYIAFTKQGLSKESAIAEQIRSTNQRISELISLNASVKRKTATLDGIESKIKELKVEYEELKTSAPICPTCGQFVEGKS